MGEEHMHIVCLDRNKLCRRMMKQLQQLWHLKYRQKLQF